MKLKSEMMSNILRMLLWPLFALSAINLQGTIIYLIDIDFYSDYVLTIDGFAGVLATILYWIIVVVYLIWIYRVHMDLNRLFLRYPRSPGKSLACILIPFYNFYGIPSLYSSMGAIIMDVPSAKKEGRTIKSLAAPLIIFLLGSNYLNRMILRAGTETSDTLLLVSSILDVVLYGVFLGLCIQVSRSLIKLRDAIPPADSEPPSNADNKEVI